MLDRGLISTAFLGGTCAACDMLFAEAPALPETALLAMPIGRCVMLIGPSSAMPCRFPSGFICRTWLGPSIVCTAMSRALNELTPHPVYGALVAYVALDCLVSKSEVSRGGWSWRYCVTIAGIWWPRCIESELGPVVGIETEGGDGGEER